MNKMDYKKMDKPTEEKIMELMKEHKINSAQRLYFEDINNKRENLIRL